MSPGIEPKVCKTFCWNSTGTNRLRKLSTSAMSGCKSSTKFIAHVQKLETLLLWEKSFGLLRRNKKRPQHMIAPLVIGKIGQFCVWELSTDATCLHFRNILLFLWKTQSAKQQSKHKHQRMSSSSRKGKELHEWLDVCLGLGFHPSHDNPNHMNRLWPLTNAAGKQLRTWLRTAQIQQKLNTIAELTYLSCASR